jgi:superfamily II DNA or RNA helicase
VAFEVIAAALRKHPHRAIVFLCPNVNVCAQQFDYFHEFLLAVTPALRDVRVHQAAGSSGKMGKDALKKLGNSGAMAVRACQSAVIFATAGTFSDLVRGCMPDEEEDANAERCTTVFARLSLLVLDECHHAVRLQGASKSGKANHDYTNIARLYCEQAPTARPKLLGLSASPGETKEDVEALLYIMLARMFSPPESLGVQVSSTATVPQVLTGRVARKLSFVCARLEKMANDAQVKEEFDAVKDIINGIKLFRTIGWGGMLTKLLEADGRVIPFGETFEQLNNDVCEDLSEGGMAASDGGESPVLKAVRQRLVAKREQGNDFRAIIFMPTIEAAHAMQQALAPLLKSAVLVGQSEQTKFMQTNTVADFHAGKFNVLVATSVAEEGLDIQKCNLVIRTEQPQSIISNIQARGRARQAGAEYVVMCMDAAEAETVARLGVREVQAEQMMSNMLAAGDADGTGGATGNEDGGTNWSEKINGDGDGVGGGGGGGGGGAAGGGGSLGRAEGAGAGGQARRGGGRSNPPFDFDADYKSQLNLHIQRTDRPGNSAEYAAQYTVETVGPPHMRVFTASVNYGGNGPYTGDPCDTKKKSHQFAAWRALQACGLHR